MVKRILSANIPLTLVIILAAALRFWRIWELDWSYDELSAILRARVNSWQAHIQSGVYPDGHPAGLQTLIWIIGDRVILLKSMAAFCGVCSVYFLYKAGKTVFGPAAGIAAALLLAIGYLPVYWSQMVRPYSFGMLFTSALFYLWSLIVYARNQNFRYFLLTGILVAACFYTHYFAAMFAVLLLLSGIINSHKSTRKLWIYSFLIATALFIPHLQITSTHIQAGGLGWLGRPQAAFFIRHLFEISGNSVALVILIFILSVSGIISAFKHQIKPEMLKIFRLFVLFIVPMITGFLYSIWRSPVLQHSVLLFTLLPALLIFGYLISLLPVKLYRLGIMVVAVTGVVVLVHSKNHYSLGYKEPYSSSLRKLMTDDCSEVKIIDGAEDIIDYKWQELLHGRKSVPLLHLLSNDTFNTAKQIQFISRFKNVSLVLNSGSSPLILPVLEDRFGIKQRTSWIGAEHFCLDKEKVQTTVYQNFQLNSSGVQSIPIRYLNPGPTDVIVMKVPAFNKSVAIHTVIKNKQKTIDYRATSSTEFPIDSNWCYHAIKLADIPGWDMNSSVEVAVFSGEFRTATKLFYRISKGNPWLYGVVPEF